VFAATKELAMKLRLLLLVLMLAGVSILMAQERPRPPVNRGPQERGTLAVGQVAPDFELPRLTLVKEGNKTVGKVGPETVKLSSFQGKRPVLLVLSSYT
jgi:hypothetical protein